MTPPPRPDLYRHPADHAAVLRLCEGVYDGSDYLPHRLPALAANPRCCCVVLRDSTGTAVAFANARALHAAHPRTPTPPPLFLESVRVLPAAYGQGLGAAVVRAAVRRGREELGGGDDPPQAWGAADIVSVTIKSNEAMLRILHRAGFARCGGSGGGRLHIWPEGAAYAAATGGGGGGGDGGGGEPLLAALGAEALIPAAARARLDAWVPLLDGRKLAAACAAAAGGAPGASGFVPGYYELSAAEGAVEALECGKATAWALPGYAGVVVVQSNPSISNKDDRVVVSVLADSVEVAEAAVVFADRRLCLPRFRAVFDANITQAELLASPLLGSVPTQQFGAFILRGDVQ